MLHRERRNDKRAIRRPVPAKRFGAKMAVRGSVYICLPVTNNYNIVIVVLHSMFVQNFGTLANLPCKTQKFWVQLAKTMKFLIMLQ